MSAIKIVDAPLSGSVAKRGRRAFELTMNWAQARGQAQKLKLRKMTARLAVFLVFGFCALVWAEIALYFALQISFEPHWAATAIVFGNGLALGGGYFAVDRWTKTFEESHEVGGSLTSAKEEFIALKEDITSQTSAYVEDKLILPYQRYAVPTAMAATFVTGLVVARALSPATRRKSKAPSHVRVRSPRSDLRSST